MKFDEQIEKLKAEQLVAYKHDAMACVTAHFTYFKKFDDAYFRKCLSKALDKCSKDQLIFVRCLCATDFSQMEKEKSEEELDFILEEAEKIIGVSSETCHKLRYRPISAADRPS